MTLKKRGEASAEEMASALDITVSGVRQHVAVLRAAGFVEHAAAKGRPGRPRHLHRLTPQAEAFFPKTYGDLTNELLAYLSDEDPAALERMFERRRSRRVHDARARLAGKPFEARVAELATILDEDGYLADFERRADGVFVITEHNCAILDVARRFGHACSTEISFIREVLSDARVERVDHMMAGAHVCRYEVTRPAGGGRGSRAG